MNAQYRFCLVLAMAIGPLFASLALAAEPAADAGQRKGPKVKVETVYRGSHIVGMPVRNDAGKDLGKIHDLVLDLHQGRIRYAALSFGGFLGLGDKLFAIPWEAMTFNYGEKDRHFVLNVSEEKLKNAQGFDQSDWPDTASAEWNAGIGKYYDTSAEESPDYSLVFRLNTVEKMDVKNDAGEKLGRIEDSVFELETGNIRYFALSFGGFLGVGDKLFAIPWQTFTVMHDKDKENYFFALHVSKDKLKSGEGFKQDEWPDTASPKWRASIDKFYEQEIREREKQRTARKEKPVR